MTLRTDYTNATASSDTHPAAHNDTNAVVNGLLRARSTPVGYWQPALLNTLAATGTFTAGQVRIVRTFVGCPFDAISVEVTTVGGAGATLTGAVYTMNNDGTPGALRVSSAPIEAVSAVGTRVLPFATQPPGAYWVGALALTNSPGIRVYDRLGDIVTTDTSPPVGATVYNCWLRAGLSALPNPFGTPVPWASNHLAPIMYLRGAA